MLPLLLDVITLPFNDKSLIIILWFGLVVLAFFDIIHGSALTDKIVEFLPSPLSSELSGMFIEELILYVAAFKNTTPPLDKAELITVEAEPLKSILLFNPLIA